MDPNQIQQPPPGGFVPVEHHPGIPVPATVPLVDDPEDELERQRKRAGITSIAVTVAVHAILVLLLALVAFHTWEENTPLIQVAGEGPGTNELQKKQFSQRITRKPSSASSNPIPTIVSNTAANIAVPEVEKIVDDPMDFGVSGIGEGLGFGGTGLGMGGGSFMGLKGGGNNIILVIDTSSSMPRNCKPEGIAAIRKEIDRTINALKSGTLFNIICYSNDVDLFQPESVKAAEETKKAAIAFMKGYFGAGDWTRTRTEKYAPRKTKEAVKDNFGGVWYPVLPQDVEGLEDTRGSSRIELGLVVALEMKPSAVFILSDGDPNTTVNGKVASDSQLIDLVDDAHRKLYKKGGSVTVNTVSINGLGETFLKKISKKFGGKHKDIRPDKL